MNNSPELTQRLLGYKIDKDSHHHHQHQHQKRNIQQKFKLNPPSSQQQAQSLTTTSSSSSAAATATTTTSSSSSSLLSSSLHTSNSLLQQQLQNDSLNNNNPSSNATVNMILAQQQVNTDLTGSSSTGSPSTSINNLQHPFLLHHITSNSIVASTITSPSEFYKRSPSQGAAGGSNTGGGNSGSGISTGAGISNNNNNNNNTGGQIGDGGGCNESLEGENESKNSGGGGGGGGGGEGDGNRNAITVVNEINPSSNDPMSPTTLTGVSKPPQRRRIRRKATSSPDDQAEHLTEMSVRGLDLFRYASITEGVYQCTECAKENVQKTFKNKYSFQRHAFLYHEGKHRKVFPCPVCGKEFSRPDKMKNHMKTTHECYIPKEVNYHPLNYLITAAAAGEIQQIFPQLENSSNSNSTSGGGGSAQSASAVAAATAAAIVGVQQQQQQQQQHQQQITTVSPIKMDKLTLKSENVYIKSEPPSTTPATESSISLKEEEVM